ncbi:MAG TPA: VOC family protein [Candidatus Acidoferrales bacterium]|nr:VOC family protein [Candidatus Acidoferrales bacterium]
MSAFKTGVQAIDHIAIPVRDLDRNQEFYVNVLGLKFKTRRSNPDGTPRQTYVLAGDNIIGLHLPGIQAGASATSAPRIAVGVGEERFDSVARKLRESDHPFRGPVEHAKDSPLACSIYFDDPDGNHLEFCIRRWEPRHECISHTVFEVEDLDRAIAFYTEALGARAPVRLGGEVLLPVESGQMIGLVRVSELSERTRKHGRGCHMAMDVTQEDYDLMVSLVERYGGKNQGDPRAMDGLRPEGERSIYLFDPDKNRLQITAHPPAAAADLLSDEEKWRRIIENRKKQGRGLSRWESGGKKLL